MQRFTDKQSVLDFLCRIQGTYTVSGIHNREPNSFPLQQTSRLRGLVGKYPGLWSGDFLFSPEDVAHRWDVMQTCKTQWEQGSLVNLMFHVTSPLSDETGKWDGDVLCTLTDAQWADLITEGGSLNRSWKKRLDIYAEYLLYLKGAGVTVLFRPFHEMNQKLFWWGGRPGSEGTAALYRLTHDYLTKEKGLTNILWIWDMQDLDYDWEAYDPGESCWDIFALDVYDNDGFTPKKYETAQRAAKGKPMAIGECQVLPSAQELREQPLWVFFMSWSELTFQYNTPDQIRELYSSHQVLIRGSDGGLIPGDSVAGT